MQICMRLADDELAQFLLVWYGGIECHKLGRDARVNRGSGSIL